MSWIKIIPVAEAKTKLKKLYDQVKSPDGHVDHILQVHSLRAHTLKGHLEIYKAALHTRPNSLSNRERELVEIGRASCRERV